MNLKRAALIVVAAFAVIYIAYDWTRPKGGQASAATSRSGASAAAIPSATPTSTPPPGGKAPAGGKPAVANDKPGGITDFPRSAGDPGTLAMPRQTPPPRDVVRQPPPPAPARSEEPPIAISVFGDDTKPPAVAPTSVSPPAPPPTPEPPPQGAARKAIPVVSESFLPMGQMIRCTLVFAVSSEGKSNPGSGSGADAAATDTPVVGTVDEDKYFDGKLIVPRGTQVHGTVGSLIGPPSNLRLRSGQRWTLVFPAFGNVRNGSELTVRGLALHRAETSSPGSWAIADGDGGLRGLALYDPAVDRIKAALATFLAAGAAGLQSTTSVPSLFGGNAQQVQNSPRNAALGGVSAVAAAEVARIQEEIQQNKVFLLVPSGTKFYLYPQQVIDLRNARVGDSAAFVRGAESDFYDQFGRRRDELPTPIEGASAERGAPPAGSVLPVPVPSAYGRGPYNLTRPAADEASTRLLPPPTR